ncbi:hypothetical protein CsSME_00027275 [Camellia sinensis var. sinensis]
MHSKVWSPPRITWIPLCSLLASLEGDSENFRLASCVLINRWYVCWPSAAHALTNLVNLSAVPSYHTTSSEVSDRYRNLREVSEVTFSSLVLKPRFTYTYAVFGCGIWEGIWNGNGKGKEKFDMRHITNNRQLPIHFTCISLREWMMSTSFPIAGFSFVPYLRHSVSKE